MVLPSSEILGSRFPDHQPEPTNTVHPGTTHRGSAALNSDSLASFVSPNISKTLSPSRLAYRVNEEEPNIWEEAETAHPTTEKDCELPKKSIYKKIKGSFKKYFGADTQETPRLKPSISIAQRIFSFSSSSASPVSFRLATPPVVGLKMRQEQLSRTPTSTREPSEHLFLPQTNSNRPQKLTENQHSQNVTLPEYGWPFGLATIKELSIVGQVPTTGMPSTNKTHRVTSRETPQRASTSTAVEPQQERNPKDQSVSLSRQKEHVRFSDPPLTGVRFIPARKELRPEPTNTVHPGTTHRGSAALNSDSLASFVSPNISTTLSSSRLAYRENEEDPSIWEEAETAHPTTKKDCEVPKKSIYNKVKRSFKKYFGADTQEAPRLKPSISIAQRIFSYSSSSAIPVSFHLATPPVVGLEMRQEQLSRTAMTRTSTREPSRHLVLPQTNSNRPQTLTENQHSQNVTLQEYGWPFGLATIKELSIVGQVPTTAMPSTNKTNRVTSRETPQRASTSTAVEP